MKYKSNRMRRILAYWIDMILSCVPCTFVVRILRLPFLGSFSMLFVLIAVVAVFVTFILRDYLFHGRSIGKRILKLKVVDENTLSEPSAKQLVVKNLFWFLHLYDGLLLIASGRSIGERATHTMVLHKKQLPDPDSSSGSVQMKATAKKRAAVAAATVLCISVPMFLVISAALSAVKKQDNYQVAYRYLMDSGAYAEMWAEEPKITLTGYSFSTGSDDHNDATSAVAAFTFQVQGKQYQVVCHRDGEEWYACSDCTGFQ